MGCQGWNLPATSCTHLSIVAEHLRMFQAPRDKANPIYSTFPVAKLVSNTESLVAAKRFHHWDNLIVCVPPLRTHDHSCSWRMFDSLHLFDNVARSVLGRWAGRCSIRVHHFHGPRASDGDFRFIG